MRKLRSQLSPPQTPEVGRGGLNNFIWGGSVRPEVQPLTLLYTIVKTVKDLNPSHFKSRLSLIVQVNVVLNRTAVVDSDRRFDNLCGSHL